MSKKLFKSTLGFASWTLLSRILGLVREMVFASLFGATMGMDAFLVAFKIPNFFRRLFAEGAFTQAFVPFLSTLQVKQSETEVKELIQVVSGTLATVVFLVWDGAYRNDMRDMNWFVQNLTKAGLPKRCSLKQGVVACPFAQNVSVSSSMKQKT